MRIPRRDSSLGGDNMPDGATRGAKTRSASAPATPPEVGTRIPRQPSGAWLTYASVVTYLVAHGWRRQELGSGWWWKDDCAEEATLGGALEQQLEADQIDQRDAIPGEPEEFWG